MDKNLSFTASRRQALTYIAGSALALGLPGAARAQTQSGPIHFIIGSTPGTGPDTMTRLIQPQLQQRWSRSVVVENKPGAGGIIGIDTVAKAAPNGNTLMLQTSTLFLLPYFYKDIPFDPLTSFTPISQVAWSTFALVVNESVPARTLPELIAWIKSQGKNVNYASPGAGTENHLFGELFKQEAGVEIMHVPYRGTANAIQDLLGGQVSMMFLPIATANNQLKSGRVRIIGCTSKERFPLMPQFPSLHEQGLSNFDFNNWYGVWGPASMPEEMATRYSEGVQSVLALPEIVNSFSQNGWVAKSSSSQVLASMGQEQFNTWRKVITDARIDTTAL
ncbi:MAG: tripartite tricarboxylate transporter substrate binding protein [Pigmentiphaga sp.]